MNLVEPHTFFVDGFEVFAMTAPRGLWFEKVLDDIRKYK